MEMVSVWVSDLLFLSLSVSTPIQLGISEDGTDIQVAKPNMNLPVLIYCRRDCGEIALEE